MLARSSGWRSWNPGRFPSSRMSAGTATSRPGHVAASFGPDPPGPERQRRRCRPNRYPHGCLSRFVCLARVISAMCGQTDGPCCPIPFSIRSACGSPAFPAPTSGMSQSSGWIRIPSRSWAAGDAARRRRNHRVRHEILPLSETRGILILACRLRIILCCGRITTRDGHRVCGGAQMLQSTVALENAS